MEDEKWNISHTHTNPVKYNVSSKSRKIIISCFLTEYVSSIFFVIYMFLLLASFKTPVLSLHVICPPAYCPLLLWLSSPFYDYKWFYRIDLKKETFRISVCLIFIFCDTSLALFCVQIFFFLVFLFLYTTTFLYLHLVPSLFAIFLPDSVLPFSHSVVFLFPFEPPTPHPSPYTSWWIFIRFSRTIHSTVLVWSSVLMTFSRQSKCR